MTPAPGRRSLYDDVAEQTASVVIRRYSTSFGLASRLLSAPVRRHIENVYALVRLADEIVDGAAAESGLDAAAVRGLLDELEAETERALATGYSTNLVVHAFGLTARATSFGAELTAPFFASMRADIDRIDYDEAGFDEYVYGSAEVVGLMCLRAFVAGREPDAATSMRLVDGARHLGAAFQKVNFLRDLSADFEALGRSYFPGVRPDRFTEDEKLRLVDDIHADLRVAAATVPLLPADTRRAVALAHGLFAELADRLRSTPAESVMRTRIRVPDPVKAAIAARVIAAGGVPARRRGNSGSRARRKAIARRRESAGTR